MKILLYANTDWYLFNFRRSLALALEEGGHEVLLVSPSGPYGDRLRELGLEWRPAPMVRKSLNPFREAALLAWLTRLMKAEQIDLVHGFTIKCVVYGAIAARLAGVKARVGAVAGMGYVFTSTDVKAACLRPLVRTLLRLALGGDGARVILQNPDDFDLFRNADLIAVKYLRLIQSSGVDCVRFAPVSAGSLNEDRFRVVLPARLLWDKGIAEYVEAARQLRAAGRQIDFLLAGLPDPGNPSSVPKDVVDEWVREGVVQWLGHVDDMPSLFQAVDVAVLPSYREGLPRGLIEAAACALPLITTDVPGCREVVKDGVNGLLIPVKNASALASAIATLQDDAALRNKLGAAARETALAKFDERLVISRTLDVYSELRNSNGSRVSPRIGA